MTKINKRIMRGTKIRMKSNEFIWTVAEVSEDREWLKVFRHPSQITSDEIEKFTNKHLE